MSRIATIKGMGEVVRIHLPEVADWFSRLLLENSLKELGTRLISPLEEYHVRKETAGKECCGEKHSYFIEREYFNNGFTRGWCSYCSYGTLTNFVLTGKKGKTFNLSNPSNGSKIRLPNENFYISPKEHPEILEFLFEKESKDFYDFNGGRPIEFRMVKPIGDGEAIGLEDTEKYIADLYFGVANDERNSEQFSFVWNDSMPFDKRVIRALIPEGTKFPYPYKIPTELNNGKDLICRLHDGP
ncbi:MAG: hypothetical protein Q8N99_05640 [Nanoarchaeota archaeon]|nr:hypothetical protein [Nanoarchaeota archaeon]